MPTVPHSETSEKWVPQNGELVHTSAYGRNRIAYTYIGRSKNTSCHVLETEGPTFFESVEVYPVVMHMIILDGKERVIDDDTYCMLTEQQ